MPKICCGPLLPCLLFLFVINAAGSEIFLSNGDRITGKVVSRTDETVLIETEFLGTLKIPAVNIDRISDDVEPRRETEALGEASKETSTVKDNVENAAENSESDPVKKGAKKAVTGDAEIPDAEKQIKPVPKLFGAGRYFGIADGWEGNANIGFSYTSGNSRTSTLATGIRATKTGHKDKLTAYVRSLWHSNRNGGNLNTTQNAVWGGGRYDRDVNDRLFGFGSLDFERDAPKGLNFRTVLGGGVGHHTIKSDRTELDILVGGAWNHAWQRGENTDTPEALGATVFKHRINDRIKFQETFTFYQDVTRLSRYRFIFDTTLSADITKRIGWFITIGDRYNNTPVGTAERNDFLFTTGMKWSFGKRGK